MQPSFALGADSAVVTAPALNGFETTSADPRVAVRSIKDRLLRVIGRAVLRLPPSTWVLFDVGLLAVSVYVAFVVLPPPLEPLATPHVALWQAEAVFAFAVIIASLVFGLYERETFLSRSRAITRMLLTTATTATIAYGIIYVIMYATVSRRVSGVAMSLFFGGGLGVRLAAWWIIQGVHCGLLVVGSPKLYESFEEAQRRGLLHEYRLMGYATLDDEPRNGVTDSTYWGAIGRRLADLIPLGVTDIVAAESAARDPGVMSWMVPCLQQGCRVTNEATFYEKATGQILVDQITPNWFLFADLKVHCDEQATLKRLMDLAIAGLMILVTVPLWPLIALAIKLCDGGPVFYSQDRVGQNGSLLTLYKFRTMRTDAENGKSIWCSPSDPRVTPVGRVLRRTRLDELPQLINVLVGRMSIVGPRPERPDIVGELSRAIPFYNERHLVKPGITGWAQISYHYGSSVEDAKRKLQFDLFYLKHMSFELDMIILFRTLGTFLRGGC